jgi:DNA-directed RNA polymerase II subunit RPB11
LKDKTIKFSGYKRAHPLEAFIEIKVQTNGVKVPSQAVRDACDDLMLQVDQMEKAFREAM